MNRETVGISLLSFSLLAFQAPGRSPLETLKGRIESITRSINAKWGIYIKCIETGEEIAVNADEQMDTMSTIKIPLMIEAYRQASEGKFKLTDMHTLKEQISASKSTITVVHLVMARTGREVARSLDFLRRRCPILQYSQKAAAAYSRSRGSTT